MELKSDQDSKVIKEKELEDGYVLKIEGKPSDKLENLFVAVSKGKEEFFEFSIDPEGTQYIGLFSIAMRLGKWPLSKSFPSNKYWRKDVNDVRFVESAGILVNWVKQVVDTGQFIQPPVRVEVLGY